MIRLIVGIVLISLFLFALYSNIKHEKLTENAAPAAVALLVPGILLIYFGWRNTVWGIVRRFKSSDPVKRRLTAMKLVETGKTGTLLRLFRESGSPEVKNAAAGALIKVGKPAVEPLIMAALWNEVNPAEAVKILERTPIQPALKLLDGPLKMQNPRVQENARYLMLEIAAAGIHSSEKDDVEASVVALEQFAASLLEKGKPADAESIAQKLLEQIPDSETARTLWKKARKAQEKDLTLDMLEEKKKQIYCEYHGILDDEFLGQSDFGKDFQRSAEKASISEMDWLLKEKSAAATFAARGAILQTYGLKEFDLDLILQQGKREAWLVTTLGAQAASEAPAHEAFRDSLRCQYCGKRNVASFWLERGDWIGFYYQSLERTREQPGAFRLPILCPFCAKIWYVVWDTSPDPLAEIFVHHIGRICDSFNHDPEKSKPFLQLLSDRVMEDLLDTIRKTLENAIAEQSTAEQIFETNSFFLVLWIVPAVEPSLVRTHLPNGYFVEIDAAMRKWDRVSKHFVHWIYCCDGQQSAIHLTFIPKKEDLSRITSMFPIELLNPDEKRQIGL